MKEKIYRPSNLNIYQSMLSVEIQDVIECLATRVHEQWAAKRYQEGWKYGLTRSDYSKEHPSLIPYNELPEIEKDYDRQTVISTIMGLIENGFEIKKME